MTSLALSPEQITQRRIRRAHAALLLMVLIWGINFPIAKAALATFTPLAFNAIRYPMAGLVVLVALLMKGGIAWPRREHRVRVIGLAVLGNVIYQLFFIYGLARTRAGTASVLLAGTPIITALLSSRIGHEKLRRATWIGAAATFSGVLIVVLASSRDGGQQGSLTGDLLMLAASAAWALYTVLSKSLIERYGTLQFTAWTLWIATLCLCIIGMPDLLDTDFARVGLAAWIGLIYSGALSIGVAYIIWYYGVGLIGNTRTSTYSNLVPVVALGAAWVYLGEVPRLGQVAGAAVIIGGLTLAQLKPVQPAVE
jgi:drug/metabolite transporter (DMT)-like permease